MNLHTSVLMYSGDLLPNSFSMFSPKILAVNDRFSQ